MLSLCFIGRYLNSANLSLISVFLTVCDSFVVAQVFFTQKSSIFMCKPSSVTLRLCFKKVGMQSVPRWWTGLILLLSVTHGMGYPLDGFRSVLWLCPFPAFCQFTASWLWGLLERALMLWQHCLAIAKHWCNTSTILCTSAEQSTVWAAVGNLTPSQPDPLQYGSHSGL